MLRFLAGRISSLLLVLVGSSIIAFALPRLAPGDPAITAAGPDPDLATVAAIRKEMGLDENLVVQYFRWLSGIFQWNLGQSYVYDRSVTELLNVRIGSTLELMIGGVLVMTLFGVVLGALGGSAKSVSGKTAIDLINTVLLSIPDFLLGLVLILVLGVSLNVLPVSGEISILEDPIEGLKSLIMPSIALGAGKGAIVGRLIESSMKANQSEQFVELAVAKGVPQSQINTRHILRNSLGAGVTGIGMRVAFMFAGAIVVESIFARAGIGSLVVDAVHQNDYFVIQAVILLAVLIAAISQIITEIVLAMLDPRVRLGD